MLGAIPQNVVAVSSIGISLVTNGRLRKSQSRPISANATPHYLRSQAEVTFTPRYNPSILETLGGRHLPLPMLLSGSKKQWLCFFAGSQSESPKAKATG